MSISLFLPDDILCSYDFFELYPFDGGGYFIQQELVHSLKDREITRNVLQGALADFGPLEKLDFRKFECWRTIEKSCWINRMYFLVSMARTAMLEDDRALAEKILEIIRHFNRSCPPPADRAAVQALNEEVSIRRDRDYNSGNAQGAIPYQWYDFQPASRIVNILNAMNFLRKFKLPQEEFRKLIADNARVIYDGDDEHHLNGGNHQTLRGLALLYAGHYLGNQEYLRAGNAVAAYHAEHDFCPDGMGVDMSPSYHVFVSWISREVSRLAELPAGLRQKLEQGISLSRAFLLPDSRSIVLNDGYSLNLRGFLASIGETSSNRNETLALTWSGMAFHRSPGLFAALDASRCLERYSHFHAGKNGVTLWLDGEPLLVDSGCCSYDNPLFWTWFKKAEAHSTLLIDGQGDAVHQGRYEWSKVRRFEMTDWQDASISCSIPEWSRRLTIAGEKALDISDRVELSRTASLDFIFVLHPQVNAEIQEHSVSFTSGKAAATLTWNSEIPIHWHLEEGKFYSDQGIVKNQRLIASVTAGQFRWTTHWRSESALSAG